MKMRHFLQPVRSRVRNKPVPCLPVRRGKAHLRANGRNGAREIKDFRICRCGGKVIIGRIRPFGNHQDMMWRLWRDIVKGKAVVGFQNFSARYFPAQYLGENVLIIVGIGHRDLWVWNMRPNYADGAT